MLRCFQLAVIRRTARTVHITVVSVPINLACVRSAMDTVADVRATSPCLCVQVSDKEGKGHRISLKR